MNWFWIGFWPNLAATFIGALLAFVTAIYLDRRIRERERIDQEDTRQKQVLSTLTSIIKSLELNQQRLSEVIGALEDEIHGFHTGIDTYTWDAVKTRIMQYHPDQSVQDLQDVLSLYYSQLASFEKTYLNAFWFVTQVASNIETSRDIAGETRGVLLSRALELKNAAEGLIEEIKKISAVSK